MVIKFPVLLAIGFLTVINSVIAQPSDDFFPKGYVPAAKGAPTSSPSSGGISDSFKEIGEPVSTATPTAAPTPILSFVDGAGSRIIWLGLVFDSSDQDSALETVEHFAQIVDRLNIRPGKIYAIRPTPNPWSNELKSLIVALKIRGASYTEMAEPPKELEIHSWPTWIIHTDAGTSILEGTNTPERNVNSRGEFIAPQP